jgi:nicotinic acid mononucleotide adenylyltransferase
MAQAALGLVDEVVFVLPRVFPHKPYRGASFEERVELLRAALAANPSISIASTNQGLFAEIAAACRSAYGAGPRLSFVCGRDAAERIVGWDYGRPGAIAEMLREFDLLVANRGSVYEPPAEFASYVQRLTLPAGLEQVSASEVREHIAQGEPWEHLVPPAIREAVLRIYSPTADSYSPLEK